MLPIPADNNPTEKTTPLRFLQMYGARLLKNGYPIVPIKTGYKFPKGLSGWQRLDATEQHLKKWLSNGFADGGVGVLTRHTPAVDIDVQDIEVVNKLVVWCEQHIGPTVQRVGRPPKRLLAYRTEHPFGKMASRVYEDMFGLTHRLEILGDGQQFVAFALHPETHKPYQWLSEYTLADVPHQELPLLSAEQAQGLIEYFEAVVPEDWEVIDQRLADKPTISQDIGSDSMLVNIKPKLNVSVGRLESCLEKLSADDYHQWIRVGMALFHQFDGNAQGLRLWDTWSQTSIKYEAHTILSKWQSFEVNLTRQEPLTAASILRLARLVDEQSTADLIDVFIDRFVYIQEGDRVCDMTKPPHCSVSKLAEFKNRTANMRHSVPAPTAKDPLHEKLEPVWKAWMVHTKRKSAEGTLYLPKIGKIVTDNYGLDWINEFHMPEFSNTDDQDKLDVFFEHMNYLFPVAQERQWFIDWMAFNLQYPERRCKVTPLHVSVAHGTGRGWVVELLGKLLGQWNLKKTKMNILAGEGNGAGFHEFLDNSLLCAIEEVKEGNKRFSVSDRIRDLLTENWLEVNIKYGGKKTQQIFTNFLFMSNHPDALVLGVEDRRVNVFSGPDKPQEKAYYDRLYDWFGGDGVTQLYNFLTKLDLSQFNWVRSMDTGARRRMIENNHTETETLFWQLMEKPPHPAMTFQQILREIWRLSKQNDLEGNIEQGQLLKLLQHHAQHWNQIKINGKKPRPWILVKGLPLDNGLVRQSVQACGD